ncbi:MAG TPA: radical SAM protein [bacterium]|nr:radical SAM protein [bacterium]
MISWTKLLFDQSSWGDRLRYRKVKSADGVRPIVVWNITPSCNLACSHCYLDAARGLAGDRFTEEKAGKVIDDLAGYGAPVLLFSGGEPLMREDIFRLARYASKAGLRPVLSTNGTMITPAVAAKIKKAGFKYVGVSIDGSPKTHDRLRGARGSFALALKGIRNCRAAGVKAGVRFTLMKQNVRDLEYVLRLVGREKIERLCVYHLVYSGRATQKNDLSHAQTRRALETVWKYTLLYHRKRLQTEVLTVDNHADAIWIYKKLLQTDTEAAGRALELLAANGGNRSGIAISCIDYEGNVFADQFFRAHPLGNVFEKRFSDIWTDANNPLLEKLRDRKGLIKGKCARCLYVDLCNGNMRVRAEAASGDLWQEDPACFLTPREIRIR